MHQLMMVMYTTHRENRTMRLYGTMRLHGTNIGQCATSSTSDINSLREAVTEAATPRAYHWHQFHVGIIHKAHVTKAIGVDFDTPNENAIHKKKYQEPRRYYSFVF